MSLVSSKKLLGHARDNGYCILGIDVFKLEILEGVLRACVRKEAPVMIQTSFINFDFYDIKLLCSMLRNLLNDSELPVILHLDHGPRQMPLDVIEAVLREGFPSVMADGSHLPLEENIGIMKSVRALADPFGASVEGELGQVSRDPSISREEVRALMTDPEQAVRFVEESAIDSLAISVGSVTACFDSTVIELDLDRLEKIASLVDIPLVFHGGTGIPDEDMVRAVEMGVSKCNVAHGLRKIYSDVMRDGLSGTSGYVDPRPLLARVMADIDAYVGHKLDLFRCSGKALLFCRDHPNHQFEIKRS